ncbi:hypothetical protein CEXT_465901 [Caerostris extrusa]|uniref:Uncharacterized protein n=1 Tax=Caerostris extrusa TaxID=172846 RepID=A0AAV4PV77_CAEEX|nr:hypothetical protein CEXT_465901 [Caerostris extrusa]
MSTPVVFSPPLEWPRGCNGNAAVIDLISQNLFGPTEHCCFEIWLYKIVFRPEIVLVVIGGNASVKLPSIPHGSHVSLERGGRQTGGRVLSHQHQFFCAPTNEVGLSICKKHAQLGTLECRRVATICFSEGSLLPDTSD